MRTSDKIGLDIINQKIISFQAPPIYLWKVRLFNKVGLALKFDTQFFSFFSGNLGITTVNNINYVGEFNLHMENLRGKADLMEINWRRLNDLSQFLIAEILEPYF